MTAFYNEIDPYAANWIRNLIAAGHIAPGVVDERSIEDIEPAELAQYTQCHFFAGIGVWSYALRLAGWPDDRPVWTGSCPCQPFSAAGKGAGFADERHLWPAFHYLIGECRPPVVFGEQVASRDGLEWLDLVQTDLEGSGYASGAADLCAAGIGAPHIRQRLYWVADAVGERRVGKRLLLRPEESGRASSEVLETARGGEVGGLADSECGGRESGGLASTGKKAKFVAQDNMVDGLADTPIGGCAPGVNTGSCHAADCGREGNSQQSSSDLRPSPTNGFWRDADWLFCRDGKWRPVESGTFPLAHGAPSRVGRLRAYGNAIVPQVAQAFIEAYLKC